MPQLWHAQVIWLAHVGILSLYDSDGFAVAGPTKQPVRGAVGRIRPPQMTSRNALRPDEQPADRISFSLVANIGIVYYKLC